MSVSSTRVRTCTRDRSAIVSNAVPPLALLVGDEITVPRCTDCWMTMPVMGARTSVSPIEILAFSSAMPSRTTEALACATARVACSSSCCVTARAAKSSCWRFNCDRALASWALSTCSVARAVATSFSGIRLSTCSMSVPRRTTSPVWTLMSRISPDALDFTCTTVSALIAPDACAVTMMSRFCTATA